MADTWVNGFFFEYNADALSREQSEGIQYRKVTDLVEEPISLEFFKLHAKIDYEFEDAVMSSYIKAARQDLEKYSQLSFGDRQMKLLALRLGVKHRLMYGPVLSIVSPENVYTIVGDIITSEEVQENVEIVYNVGWGSPGLPETIKIAICQTAAGLYAHRENLITDINFVTVMDQAKKMVDKEANKYFL